MKLERSFVRQIRGRSRRLPVTPTQLTAARVKVQHATLTGGIVMSTGCRNGKRNLSLS